MSEQIEIKTVNGIRSVDCAVVFGQWAVHQTVDNRGWHVTHVPTGLCIRQAHRGVDLTELQARMIALRLSETVPVLRSNSECSESSCLEVCVHDDDADRIVNAVRAVLRQRP